MTKLNATWTVLIIFCSLIVIGGIFYLFYRIYINQIYKRRRVWNEITLPMKNRTEEKQSTDLQPRQSIIPLIQEFLSNDVNKQTERRKMVTKLQFDEPPLFEKNFSTEWIEMDGQSVLSSLSFMSTRTSYYTIRGELSDHETIKFEENDSQMKYFSMSSSSDPWMTPLSSAEKMSSMGDNSRRQSPFALLDYSSSNNFIDHNKKNYIVIDLESIQRINLSNNPYKL